MASFITSIDPDNPLSVCFDASGSAAMSVVEILEFRWNFGDGSSCDDICKANLRPVRTYAKRGFYTVTLTVVDHNFGESRPEPQTILVGNKPPDAVLSGPTRVFVNKSVTFDGGGSSDEDGTVEFWEFRFGDEPPATSGAIPQRPAACPPGSEQPDEPAGTVATRIQRPTAQHTYTATGEYTVELTVVDNDDLRSRADSQRIRVIDEDTVPPTVAIQTPSADDILREPVRIRVTAEDNVDIAFVEFLIDGALRSEDDTQPYSYFWDVRQEQNGSHVIRARAIDSSGNTAQSAPVPVTVQNP